MTGGNGERNENGKQTGHLRRRRRGTVAVVAATALLATTAGLRATDTWPFRGDSHCWGAWQEREGEGPLGDRILDRDDAERFSEESPPPTTDRPEGTCELTVRERGGTERDVLSLSAAYGRPPADARDHRTWIAQYLHGSAAALPDGLDGVASGDRAMLVLPAACDVDGRPSTVTLDGGVGDEAVMARLLVDLANTAMEKAGCAPDTPLSFTSPFTELPQRETPVFYSRLCGIPGVEFDRPVEAGNTEFTGAYGTRLQICSVDGRVAAHYVMTGTPRLGALFAGLPEGPGRGLVRKTCDGRPTVFYGEADALGGTGVPDDQTVFTRFVASVSKRIGCDDGGRR
ncbi:hypothetical protein [Streptomyces sp. enrichment culture]|uniref:hypothetical protein n=1 Tax=Streptomyces sp. enrichment culture TaxID=1795815 RepID=UPI003F57882A